MILILCVSLQLLQTTASAVEMADIGRPVIHLPADFRSELDLEGLWILPAAGAATLVARPDDGRVQRAVLSDRPLGNSAATAASWAGDTMVLAPACGVLYFAGLWAGNPPVSRFGEMSLEALGVSGLEAEVFKVAIRRERPDGADHYSFPSGHAVSAFSVATVAAEEWGWWAGVPANLVAGLIAYSRLEKNKHYLSDVIFGAGLGIASGRAVWRAHGPGGAVTFQWTAFPGGAAVALKF